MKWLIAIALMFGSVIYTASDQKNEENTEPEADRLLDYRSGVIGGAHDFTDRPGGPANPCAVCHVPHVQAVRLTTRPATQPTSQPAVQIYRIPGQRQVFQPDRYTPGPTSLVCLGCHDGTVATSTIGSGHALLGGVREGFELPDGFIWRDHPIGILYPEHNRDYQPKSFIMQKGKIPLPQGRVECISCHDPHNEAGLDDMLVMPNRRSRLCLSCHIK
jgi:predicted CXXCH cytochrome family protein